MSLRPLGNEARVAHSDPEWPWSTVDDVLAPWLADNEDATGPTSTQAFPHSTLGRAAHE